MPLWAASLAATLLCASVAHAAASQVWAEVGDGRMRADLELLADSGVIDLPLNDWPIPVADIEHEMGKVDRAKLTDPSLQAAYDRIQTTLQPDSASGLHLTQEELAAGERGLLRDYDTPSRADGGATAEVADYGDRWAVELNMNYAISPQDGQPFRLDDSNLTARFGNWLVSLNTLDKWWGPSYESSLILSNNARPMPALELDRATSAPIDLPILRWLGPWRFIMYVATAEEHRPDVDDSLFFGNRISWRPLRFLEIGLSRTTQFCGSGRNCGLTTWKNVLLGNDTTQYASVADKPGHAEAGYEARLNSPWRSRAACGVYADHRQRRDQSPAGAAHEAVWARELAQSGNGDTIKGFAEYSDSTCGAGRVVARVCRAAPMRTASSSPANLSRLNIADSADPNAILRTLGLRWDRSAGDEWQLKIQSGHFDRGNIVNIFDTVSPTRQQPLRFRSGRSFAARCSAGTCRCSSGPSGRGLPRRSATAMGSATSPGARRCRLGIRTGDI